MNLQVEQSDIKNIGHTVYPSDGNLTIFVGSLQTANIEEILLRNILKCFDEEYVILFIEDREGDNVGFITTLPWDIYINV